MREEIQRHFPDIPGTKLFYFPILTVYPSIIYQSVE